MPLLKVKIFEGEVGLHNTSGLHSCSQDILLSGDVGRIGYSVQVIQVAEKSEKNRFKPDHISKFKYVFAPLTKNLNFYPTGFQCISILSLL